MIWIQILRHSATICSPLFFTKIDLKVVYSSAWNAVNWGSSKDRCSGLNSCTLSNSITEANSLIWLCMWSDITVAFAQKTAVIKVFNKFVINNTQFLSACSSRASFATKCSKRLTKTLNPWFLRNSSSQSYSVSCRWYKSSLIMSPFQFAIYYIW